MLSKINECLEASIQFNEIDLVRYYYPPTVST